MIKPSRGRIVLYHPAGHGPDEEPHAAMVIAVHNDHLVNLACFSPEGTYYHRLETQLLQDDDAAPEGGNYAECMAFQKGQTPASSAVTEQLAKISGSIEEHAKLLETGGTIHKLFTDLAGKIGGQFAELEQRLVAAGVPLQPAPAPALHAPTSQPAPGGGATEAPQANPAPQPDPQPAPAQQDPAVVQAAAPQPQVQA